MSSPITSPEIVELPARRFAAIRVKTPRDEMPNVFGPTVGELVTALASQGVQPDGGAFAHHLTCEEGFFDFELGFFLPVSAGPCRGWDMVPLAHSPGRVELS